MLELNSLIILLFLVLPLAAMILGVKNIQNPRKRQSTRSVFSPTRINEYTNCTQLLKG